MDSHAFRDLVEDARRKNPAWFGLEPDPPASVESLAIAEGALGLTLPSEYTRFLLEYGGGYFAFAVVFSVCPGSQFNVVDVNATNGCLEKGFLAFSENGAGDFIGYRVRDGATLPGVIFADHESEYRVASTRYSDIWEYLAEVALRVT